VAISIAVASAEGPAMSGTEFVKRFGGLIPPDELDRMEAAIERDCETVEPSNGR
jgi:hypothetical protein